MKFFVRKSRPNQVKMPYKTMTNDEIYFIINAIREIVENIENWQTDYDYDLHKNEFFHTADDGSQSEMIRKWFSLSDDKHIKI